MRALDRPFGRWDDIDGQFLMTDPDKYWERMNDKHRNRPDLFSENFMDLVTQML